MPLLELYRDYTRNEVHDIFAPDAPFTPQSRTWGLHGIIIVPDRPNDFLFFVTFGQRQGTHVFDEGITDTGVLSWQSQPRQGFHHPQVQQFIQHDALAHTIYLFLRTASRQPYTYLGRLKYLRHDSDREYPVYFQWQLLDWPPPPDVVRRMHLDVQVRSEDILGQPAPLATAHAQASRLVIKTYHPLTFQPRQGTTQAFRAQKGVDYAEVDARNRALGRAGECLVLHHEREMLMRQGRPDLAQRVRHVAEIEGDGAGYDVLSFAKDGTVKYIEVKTTRGSAETAFFLSANELAFARQHSTHYFVYRIYGYHSRRTRGNAISSLAIRSCGVRSRRRSIGCVLDEVACDDPKCFSPPPLRL
jgi:Domain of unknown function (DUF3883)/Domain of unknown function (DUF3427)